MGRWGASFLVSGADQRPAEGVRLTLQSSLMTRGVSNGEHGLGARIRFLSSATSWSSGSPDGWAYTSI